MPRLLLACLLVALAAPAALAQRDGVLEIDDGLERFLLRQQTAGHLRASALDLRPVSAQTAQALLDSLAADSVRLSRVDQALLDRYRGVRPGPNVTRLFGEAPLVYRDSEVLYREAGDGWAVEAEPLLYLSAGRTRRTARGGLDPTAPTWQNTRGLRAAGHIGRHAFFETRVEENQRRPALLDYDAAERTSPRIGNSKIQGGTTLDYWRVSGAVGYQDRFLDIRLGRDQNRWGPGRNSLVLSDFAPSYDQLQVRATVGRFAYTSLATRFTQPIRPGPRDGVLPSRYGALHRLQIALPGGVDLGLSEMVMFADDTTNGNRYGFEIAYLNPIIFYRAVEADQGSPDNVLLAADLAVRPVGGVRAYGQLVIDELRISELGSDWWGNKYGWMVGAHLVDPGVPNLDLRVEYARLRPYLYSHRSRSSAFVHYADGLGHAAGPNATDVSGFLRYRPTDAIELAVDGAYTVRGRNTETENFGGDPRESFDTRVSEYGIETLQGVRQEILLGEARIGYEILPRLVVEAALVAESTDDAETGVNRAVSGYGQVRWGLPFRSQRW